LPFCLHFSLLLSRANEVYGKCPGLQPFFSLICDILTFHCLSN